MHKYRYIELVFTESAFNHDCAEEEIRECIFNNEISPMVMCSTQDSSVYLLHGVTYNNRFLEIAFRKEEKDLWKVFHAMNMKSKDKRSFKRKRGL